MNKINFQYYYDTNQEITDFLEASILQSKNDLISRLTGLAFKSEFTPDQKQRIKKGLKVLKFDPPKFLLEFIQKINQ